MLEAFLGPSEYRTPVSASSRAAPHAGHERHLPRLADADRDLDGRARDFYVRQLRDWKGSVDVDAMTPEGLALYGRLCGWTLARAHARSGDRIAIAAYSGSGDVFDRALVAFGESYADQNERDYAALGAAVKSGRVIAQTGV